MLQPSFTHPLRLPLSMLLFLGSLSKAPSIPTTEENFDDETKGVELKELGYAINEIDRLYNDTEPTLSTQIQTNRMMLARRCWGWHTRSDRTAHERRRLGGSPADNPQILSMLEPVCTSAWDEKIAREDSNFVSAHLPNPYSRCDNSNHRRIDGRCNNVRNPEWGASYAPLQRLLAPDYADEVSEPRRSIYTSQQSRVPLPNPRLLSNLLFNEPNHLMEEVVALTPHWAFFIHSDLVHLGSAQLFNGVGMSLGPAVQEAVGRPIPCCSDMGRLHPECYPILITPDDPKYYGLVDCMEYARSVIAPRSPQCGMGAREQANQATGFLDGSVIYGSTEEQARKVRTFRDGRLLTSHEGELPPTLDQLGIILPPENIPCTNAIASSEHVNLLPTVASLHAVLISQHNRVALKLMRRNKRWSDEQLFQESRKIVIAQLQHITYTEFLPLIIGRETWKRYELNSAENGESYDLDMDPSTFNVYASAVGQFFYTMIEGHLAQYGADGLRQMDQPLSHYLYEPSALFFSGKVDGFLKYLLRQSAHRPGLHMTSELKDKLFKGGSSYGLDLAALILQTGRDHGIPGYVAWREKCRSSRVSSFDELHELFIDASRVVPILSRHFKSVDDIDLFIGALAERPLRGELLLLLLALSIDANVLVIEFISDLGSLVGPTLGCLLALQFQRTKRGDRFWYENRVGPWAFSDAQLAEIRKTTLARILCDNSDLHDIQPSAFEAANAYDNFPILCNSTMLGAPDIDAWSDSEALIQMPVTTETIRKAIALGTLAATDQRRRESRNIAKNQGKFQPGDPLLSYGQMMRPKREAIHVNRLSHALLEATKLILAGDPNVMNSGERRLMRSPPAPLSNSIAMQQILPQIDITAFLGNIEPFLGEGGSIEQCLPRDLPCDHTTPYRTFTGWCNNLRFPHYGNSFGPLRHLLPPVYEDGIDAPRSRAKSGRPLPSPRVISNAVHIDLPFDHAKLTHMVMQFGQILDHEMTHSPVERGPNDEILNCTRCDSHRTLSEHCMPLPVPEGDPHFNTHDAKGERRCLPFARSVLGQLSLGYRNQLNQLTAFIDGSSIYGSTPCEAAMLRLFEGGRLNFTDLGEVNPEALPQGDQEQDCRSKPRFPCFVAGDERNSHQPGLTTMHNMFLREHNRIARGLEAMNPLWDDEKIYQETRRIIGAIFQHIVYKEYLPKLIGKQLVDRHGLVPRSDGYFTEYDSSCDASISHPFATAAFRFGHTLIRRFFPRLNSVYANYTRPVDLVDNFNNVEAVYDTEAGGIDTILVGLLGTPSMAFDRMILATHGVQLRHITNAVRNHLFAIRNVPLSGLDLISLNILRARDHGVQSYNTLREYCGLPRAHSFSELASEMDSPSIAALQSVYEHVDDIDLFPGLFSERPMGGALMPPTMACLIAEQFTRLKHCDRFYYENDAPEVRFTPEQLAEIRKVTLGSLLCQNFRILSKIQPDVFSLPDQLTNAQIPCADFPQMNLEKWMDRGVCYIGNDQVPRGATKLKSPCVKCMCTADGPRCRAMRILSCENLMDNFLLSDIREDMSCLVQCSTAINNRAASLGHRRNS